MTQKTDAAKLSLKHAEKSQVHLLGQKASIKSGFNSLMALGFSSAFFLVFAGCVMTQAQGDRLATDLRELKQEVARLQRVRHDVEALLSGPVKSLHERVAKLEDDLGLLRTSVWEGFNKSEDLLSQIQFLLGSLEETKHKLDQLEKTNSSPGRKNGNLEPSFSVSGKEAFILGQKLFEEKKYSESIWPLQRFLDDPSALSEKVFDAHYYLAECYRKKAEQMTDAKERLSFQKRAIVSFNQALNKAVSESVREEVIYQIGTLLQTMGNKKEALSAFQELVSKYKNGKHLAQAQKIIKELQKP